MADKQVNLALGADLPAYQKYEAAQKALENMLAERENRLFDPTLLAMAQGFLSPTKTGSFGESLGNVAGALAPVQAAEDKRATELAKMRLEVAQQGVQTGIQAKRAQQGSDFMKNIMSGGVPDASVTPPPVAAEAPKPSAQPAVGGLPAMAPPPSSPLSAPLAAPAQAAPAQASAPLSAPAPAPLAPPVASAQPPQPAGVQLFPAQQQGYSEQEKMIAASMYSEGKAPYEIMQAIDEYRRKGIVVEKGQTTDVRSGRIYTDFDPTPTETYIDGFGNLKIPASQAKMYGRERDPAKRAALAKEIIYGLQNPPSPPSPPSATSTGAPPAGAPAQEVIQPKARPTVEQEEAERAGSKKSAEKTAEGKADRTSEVMKKVEVAESVRYIAQNAKTVINQPGSEAFMGIFEKPKIKTALALMLEDSVFAPTNFRTALTAANIPLTVARLPNESGKEYEERKQDVFDRFNQATVIMAQARFEASRLASGQGTITEGERKLFSDTTINTKMSVNSFNKIADMLIERSKFAEDLGRNLTESKMQIDDFKQTPAYKKMAKDYENRLSEILRSGRPSSSPSARPSSGGRPDLDAAQANVERQLR
jgi:hypothetical protein